MFLFSYKVNPQVNLRLVNDRLVITQNDLYDNDTVLVGPHILNLAGTVPCQPPDKKKLIDDDIHCVSLTMAFLVPGNR
jgi:hypothetical protein